MDLALTGRRVLVADAASPAGTALARLMAAEGSLLRLAGRDGKALEELGHSLGQPVEVLPADLRDPVEADVLALRCDDLDLLLACAGAAPPAPLGAPLVLGWEDRVLGLANLMREVHSLMTQAAGGRPKAIVAVGMPPDTLGAKAGNAALFAVVRHLAGLRAPGLHVAAVDPGRANAEEVAAAAAFLASSFARSLNGTVLALEGAS